ADRYEFVLQLGEEYADEPDLPQLEVPQPQRNTKLRVLEREKLQRPTLRNLAGVPHNAHVLANDERASPGHALAIGDGKAAGLHGAAEQATHRAGIRVRVEFVGLAFGWLQGRVLLFLAVQLPGARRV